MHSCQIYIFFYISVVASSLIFPSFCSVNSVIYGMVPSSDSSSGSGLYTIVSPRVAFGCGGLRAPMTVDLRFTVTGALNCFEIKLREL